MYAKCRYAGRGPSSCSDYARLREATELDGPLGTLVIAPAAAISLGLLAVLVERYLQTHPQGAVGFNLTWASKSIDVTGHAMDEMIKGGVTPQQVANTLDIVKPFAYFQNGAWQLGFYDHVNKIFVAVRDGKVWTVIENASQQYVQNVAARVPW